ncbi:MAG: DUF1684 domain-containing protein [Candidatus Binatia bacterium]
MLWRTLWASWSLVFWGLALTTVSFGEEGMYHQEIESWRQERETRLKADDGWLTIVGLYWLNDGENAIGSGPTNDIILPTGSAPAQIGVFTVQNSTTTFTAAPGVPIRQHGKNIRMATLTPGPGTGAAPDDAVIIGGLTLWLHKSGARSAIRVRDKASQLRTNFTGCRWFPVDPTYRVTARFVPYAEPKSVIMANVLGDREHYTSPGIVEFALHGQELRLEPVSSGSDRLFFVFRDGTSGNESYGAARFLTTDGPQNGHVILDFNKAVNPPCAYNPFTSCPLPSKENRLTVRIEAGELDYHKGGSDGSPH